MSKPKAVHAGCPKCGGSGHFGDDSVASNNPFCPDCKGGGRLTVPEAQTAKCPECNGRGHADTVPCFGCCHTGNVIVTPPAEGATPIPKVEDVLAENAALKKQVAELEAKLAAKPKGKAKTSDIIPGAETTEQGVTDPPPANP